MALDFQDQDLKVVLDALVAAGDLNVTMTNIPSQRVTVHMGKPVDARRHGRAREERRGSERTQGHAIADADADLRNGARAAATRGTTEPRAATSATKPATAMRLFTYRLKHASAVQLAPVLTNLFAGVSGCAPTGATTIFPNANGGFTTINTGPPAAREHSA